MITKDQATASHQSSPDMEGKTWTFWDNWHFCHPGYVNADGNCTNIRRNGQTKTWKTRPDHFEIPVKVGFRGHDYITHTQADEWYLQEECPNCNPKCIICLNSDATALKRNRWGIFICKDAHECIERARARNAQR